MPIDGDQFRDVRTVQVDHPHSARLTRARKKQSRWQVTMRLRSASRNSAVFVTRRALGQRDQLHRISLAGDDGIEHGAPALAGWRQLAWPACCPTRECYAAAACRLVFFFNSLVGVCGHGLSDTLELGFYALFTRADSSDPHFAVRSGRPRFRFGRPQRRHRKRTHGRGRPLGVQVRCRYAFLICGPWARWRKNPKVRANHLVGSSTST